MTMLRDLMGINDANKPAGQTNILSDCLNSYRSSVCYFHAFILLKEEEVEEGRNTVWIKLIAQIAHFKQNSLTKSRLQIALEPSHVMSSMHNLVFPV